MAETICHRPQRLRLLLAAALIVGIAVALAWGWGLTRFAAAIPTGVADSATASDAIVVLTGGSERLTTGLDLLAGERAGWLFVSGVYPGVDRDAMVRRAGGAAEGLMARIEMGHGALDTAGNAQETAAWMRRHGHVSLRLVTASYHMPRSLLEFSHAMPEATIVPHPVFPRHVKQARWWLWPGTAMLIIGEYNKYLWSVARIGLTALLSPPPTHG